MIDWVDIPAAVVCLLLLLKLISNAERERNQR